MVPTILYSDILCSAHGLASGSVVLQIPLCCKIMPKRSVILTSPCLGDIRALMLVCSVSCNFGLFICFTLGADGKSHMRGSFIRPLSQRFCRVL